VARPPLSRRHVLAGVALVSLCVLMLQLTLTRPLAAMYYHFAFLAISLALFGPGPAASPSTCGPQARCRRARLAGGRLVRGHTVAALLVVLGGPLSRWITAPDPGATRGDLRRVRAPFFFAGCAVTLAVTASRTTWAGSTSSTSATALGACC
jgi:hypothetical protein